MNSERTSQWRERGLFATLLVPTVLAAAVFVLAIAEVLQYSFRAFIPGSLEAGGFTLDNFHRINRPIYLTVLVETCLISLATAFFTLLASYPVAYALVRARSHWLRSLIMVLSITPLFTGEIVRTYAWMLVLGTDGFINSLLKKLGLMQGSMALMYTPTGVIIALVQFSMPVMIIMLAAALSHLNTDYEKAAANLGARPGAVFWRITLPLTLPGVIAGFVVIFAWTMSAFSTPQLIGGGKVLMISNLVYLQGFSSFNFPFAAALSLIALIAALGSLGFMRPVVSRIERRVARH